MLYKIKRNIIINGMQLWETGKDIDKEEEKISGTGGDWQRKHVRNTEGHIHSTKIYCGHINKENKNTGQHDLHHNSLGWAQLLLKVINYITVILILKVIKYITIIFILKVINYITITFSEEEIKYITIRIIIRITF